MTAPLRAGAAVVAGEAAPPGRPAGAVLPKVGAIDPTPEGDR